MIDKIKTLSKHIDSVFFSLGILLAFPEMHLAILEPVKLLVDEP